MEEYSTPVEWNSDTFSFTPVSFISDAPCFDMPTCQKICKALSNIVKDYWSPAKGDIYYHPFSWYNGKFIPTDNQAAFDECPYPAYRTLEECQKNCNQLNTTLDSFIPLQIDIRELKVAEVEPIDCNTIQTLEEILKSNGIWGPRINNII